MFLVKVADKETNPNQLNKRHKIVSELLDTEQSYIKSLQFIFDVSTWFREDRAYQRPVIISF